MVEDEGLLVTDKGSWCNDSYGTKYWHCNEHGDRNSWRRLGGPSCWHRIDGPAIERDDGTKEWRYHGQQVNVNSQEEFERWLRLRSFW
jgi:hypothetical protein